MLTSSRSFNKHKAVSHRTVERWNQHNSGAIGAIFLSLANVLASGSSVPD
jgi:hypothetical protein